MHRVVKIAVILLGSAGFMLAESWTGTLMDANCKADQNQSESQSAKAATGSQCLATSNTKAFSIQTSEGNVYKLDSTGNSKAAAAMKENSDKTSVTVNGSLEGQTVKVQSVDVR